MENIEVVYYALAILGIIVTAIISIARISNNLRGYVDQSVEDSYEKLSMKIDHASVEQKAQLDKVERNSISKRLNDEHAQHDIQKDVSALKSQVSAHDARFSMLESLLTEVRGDVKTLLSRKD